MKQTLARRWLRCSCLSQEVSLSLIRQKQTQDFACGPRLPQYGLSLIPDAPTGAAHFLNSDPFFSGGAPISVEFLDRAMWRFLKGKRRLSVSASIDTNWKTGIRFRF